MVKINNKEVEIPGMDEVKERIARSVQASKQAGELRSGIYVKAIVKDTRESVVADLLDLTFD